MTRWRDLSILCMVSCGVAIGAGAITAPARAVGFNDDGEPPTAGTEDYLAGKAAFEREDWPAVIEHMDRAVEA